MEVCSYPNAKINLGLHITEKRLDGFHNIETVFYPIVNFFDKLTIVRNKEKMLLNISNLKIDGDWETNLCVKAYRLLQEDFELPDVHIFLEKNIPIGSGLGGGSSDAAFLLKAVRFMFKLDLTDKQLMNYAAKIGSDCAFFIKNIPMFATGRGEILTETTINLSEYYLVLVKPDIHISTKEAYSLVTPKKRDFSLKEKIENTPIEKWKDFLVNDFEEFLFDKYPVIRLIKQELYEAGALYASMTGSGSAIYGIFRYKSETEVLNSSKIIYKDYLYYPLIEYH